VPSIRPRNENSAVCELTGYDADKLKDYEADTESKPVQIKDKKKLQKVYERVGRLKEKYPSVHKYYDITIQDDGKDTATSISCCHKTGEDKDKKARI